MDNNLEVNYLKKELYELIKSDESIFDFIQESSVDGLWYWDLENPENEWMNPKFWMVLGYNPKEMPHKSSSWQSIINQDDLKAAMERVAFHLENPNHPYDQIVRYTHKNGSTVWIRCRGMAIRDKNGKPVRMLGAHHDISELKTLGEDLILLNEKAEENNSNIKAILEGTKDSIWSFDRNYNIIYINNIFQNEFESSFGIRLEKGSNLIMALPEYLRPFWEPRYNRVLSGEQFSIVDEVDTAIGRLYILVTFNPIIKNGVVTGGSCFGSNITERKKAEYELQQSQKRLSEKEAQYRLLAENSQDLIYVYNLVPEPRYEYISPSCLQLTGYEPEICYSDPFTYHKFINTSSGLERFTQFLLNPEQPPRIEEEWKRKDGSYIWVEQVVARNFDENGNLISFQSTVRDITERKHAEERLRESEEKYKIGRAHV